MDGAEELLAFWIAEDPDPVDVFEDQLTALLGVHRHPSMSYDLWRQVRVGLIEAAGEKADEFAIQVEAAMTETDREAELNQRRKTQSRTSSRDHGTTSVQAEVSPDSNPSAKTSAHSSRKRQRTHSG